MGVERVPTAGPEARDDDPGACGRRGQGQYAEHDAGQEHAADRAKSSHVRLWVEAIINRMLTEQP